MMKLDRNKPFGHVMGHSKAQFEQNGVLFDGQGQPVKEVREIAVKNSREDVRTFLLSALAGGQVSQNNLYRDSQARGFVWSDVKEKAAELNIRQRNDRGVFVWSLT